MTFTIEMISIKEEVPDCQGAYLCRFQQGELETIYIEDLDLDFLTGKSDFCPAPWIKDITHWAVIPSFTPAADAA